ncbi:hypothetical protein M1L60_08505 [Actinoplanes sp. TRM 88003]|uniref:Uncharacterized protein n=1 Tax=Paractinoplanes aksuensis TaxID=2939490 RepID=A0ABT1DII2_9ACTN|nr:hypothetical protein [Actinoplanes aksuensis]MCO8270638.1 hypothetical protein [Actinoplanes aksuensis]
MTAPGDLVLIILLVAVFVASCGYAAGRMHQRYQLKQDREAAYRDGYETASSKVFSLAARVASRKRPARGAAAVQPGSAAGGAASPGSSGAGLPGSGRVRPGASPSGAAAPGPGRAGSDLPGSSLAGAGSPGAGVDAGKPFDLSREGGAVTSAATGVGAPGPAGSMAHSAHSADPGRAFRHQGVPGPELIIPRRRRSASDDLVEEANGLGFPAPPPPPRNTVAEPAALGGVNYQLFRDPRPADGSAPVLGRRDTPADASMTAGGKHTCPTDRSSEAGGKHTVLADASSAADGNHTVPTDPPPATSGKHTVTTHASSAADGLHTSTANSSSAADGLHSSTANSSSAAGGRHTVPDELVQAATYRLPPDRVFRAKVPNSTPLPEQTTTHLSVPKPRRRADDNVVPPS